MTDRLEDEARCCPGCGSELSSVPPPTAFRQAVTRYRRWLLRRALLHAQGNQARAARSVGLPVRTFVYNLHQLGIVARAYRPAKRKRRTPDDE